MWYLVPRLGPLRPKRAAIGRVRTGQLAAVLGANAATVDDDLKGPGGGLGVGSDHPEPDGVEPWQQGDSAPLAQPSAQGRAGGATGIGQKLAPLDPFTQEEL